MHIERSSFDFGDTRVEYVSDDAGRVGLVLLPSAKSADRLNRRGGLAGLAYIDAMPGAGNPLANVIDPLVHVKIAGEPYCGAFAQGHTMRSSPGAYAFTFVGRDVGRSGGRTTVVTRMADALGRKLEHQLTWHENDRALTVTSRFVNGSPFPVTLELLTSFSLGGITPFHAADAPGRLRVHRFRSVWSAEGRLDTQTIEQLHLERSWSGAGLFSERFGQLGTMPVRRWFPFAAVEDSVAGVTWGAQLAWAGTWQIEISRQHDDVCLSGGLGDRELGHWTKTLAPGESIESPPAVIACVQGGLDELCDRLTAVQQRAADTHPAIEHHLPIVFNEWCTTWGDPAHDKITAIAGTLRGSPVKYLVIDAGWYKPDGGDWGRAHGDWTPSRTLFPNGLAATADEIRQRGLVPGLWFEMETVGDTSAAFSLVDHLLQRDGQPITVRHRRFWNLNDPFAVDYLTDNVIGLLRDGGFGYLKVDYNETAGLGCDGAESLGEGLRQQVHASYRFFERIRESMPNLVIENCASGGHRLEPSMLARTAMSSFSDAHELVEIPIIAANLHRLMLPRQSQIWAVLHPSDSDDRLVYSLAATFLGRMCLSGDIAGLSPTQRKWVDDAMQLYQHAALTIKHGTSRRFGSVGDSWRHPTGWQSVRRLGADDQTLLVVTHAFADVSSDNVQIPLPNGGWRLVNSFTCSHRPTIADGRLMLSDVRPFTSSVLLLRREK